MTEYITICQSVVGNELSGYTIDYSTDGKRFSTRAGAIKNGFEVRQSDDFNVGVVNGNKLVSFDWMDDPVGEDADGMAEIQRQIFGDLP